MLQTLKNINYYNEQSKMLFQAKSGFIGSNLFGPIVIAFALKDFVPINLLSTWLFLLIGLFMLRLNLANKALQALQRENQHNIDTYLKQYLIFIFLNALLLGLSGFFVLLYTNTVYTLFIVLGIVIIITGSLSTLTPIYHAVFIFITTTLSTFIVALLLLGSEPIHTLILITLLAYITIVIPSSFRIFKQLQNNILQAKELTNSNKTLEEYANNFKYLIDSALEAIIVSDENLHVVQTNKAALKMFGLTKIEEGIGVNILDFIPNDVEKEKALISLSKDISEPFEINLKNRTGTIFPTLLAGRTIIRDSKKYRLTTIIDLSELQFKDQQMLQQSRLAQMGEMISMIAHQWRQPLSAIASRSLNVKLKLVLKSFKTDTVEGKEEEKNYIIKELDAINHLVNVLSTTVDDFRNFYKPSKNCISSTLTTVLKKSFNIIKPSLEHDSIELDYFSQDNESIHIHENEMIQVVLNIFKNAQDNFKEKNIQHPKIQIRIEEKTLTICDNGGGIKEDILDQIFDPYFSTKMEKDGTGIGLYMSKIIVENHHHGKLEVFNHDAGVCFKITLS